MRGLTPRGNLVAGLALALAFAGIWWIAGHLWYVEGEGYCVGLLVKCFH